MLLKQIRCLCGPEGFRVTFQLPYAKQVNKKLAAMVQLFPLKGKIRRAVCRGVLIVVREKRAGRSDGSITTCSYNNLQDGTVGTACFLTVGLLFMGSKLSMSVESMI